MTSPEKMELRRVSRTNHFSPCANRFRLLAIQILGVAFVLLQQQNLAKLGLDSMDDEYMPSAPSFPDSKQPHSESISAIVDESNNSCSPPSTVDKECDVEQLQLESEELLDDSGVLDGETKQQSEPLTTDKPSCWPYLDILKR